MDFGGELDAAYRQALRHQDGGRHAEALALFDTILRKHSDAADILVRRGVSQWALRRFDEALASFERAALIEPGNVDAHYSKGTVLQSLHRRDEALQSYDRALRLRPDLVLALNNKAVVLRDLKRVPEAIAHYDKALAIQPNNPAFLVGKAFCLMLLGDFARGLPLLEWRKAFVTAVGDAPAQGAFWLGENLEGKSLLIRSEQGLGDTIQFCRYALVAKARGAKVVLGVQDNLVRLLQSLDPDVTVLGGQKPFPVCDYKTMLLTMPLRSATTPTTIPAMVPYLFAEPARAEDWRQKLAGPGFKVGIAWQGERRWQGVDKPEDIGRSFPLLLFQPVADIPSVRLISLQKNDGTEQLADLPVGMKVEMLDALDDGADAFLDTAAVMQNLDLIITSDTAIAHLAGALGRPVWLALRHVPDWRWKLEGDDTQWYPTMHLFRQNVSGDWTEVFARIAARLRSQLGV
jgi:tetratricopeptide (TPR) repeat protein